VTIDDAHKTVCDHVVAACGKAFQERIGGWIEKASLRGSGLLDQLKQHCERDSAVNAWVIAIRDVALRISVNSEVHDCFYLV